MPVSPLLPFANKSRLATIHQEPTPGASQEITSDDFFDATSTSSKSMLGF
jgi:hypothetical protein